MNWKYLSRTKTMDFSSKHNDWQDKGDCVEHRLDWQSPCLPTSQKGSSDKASRAGCWKYWLSLTTWESQGSYDVTHTLCNSENVRFLCCWAWPNHDLHWCPQMKLVFLLKAIPRAIGSRHDYVYCARISPIITLQDFRSCLEGEGSLGIRLPLIFWCLGAWLGRLVATLVMSSQQLPAKDQAVGSWLERRAAVSMAIPL